MYKYSKLNFNAKYSFYLEQGLSHRDALVQSLKVHSVWASVSYVEAIPGWEEELYIVELFYYKSENQWVGSSPNDGGTEYFNNFLEAHNELVRFGMYRIG